MTVNTPDWLSQHEGEVRCSRDGQSCTVYLGGQPQYVLIPVPAKGQYACRVSMTNNGRRLDSPTTYPTAADAVRGGLEDLRKALGW
jgi:hypothetical protein